MNENRNVSGGEGDLLLRLVPRFLEDDPAAAEELCRRLTDPVRRAARGFFPADHADLDDVIQETIIATLGYIRKKGGFEGDLIRFAVTVARNRCRNILSARRRRPEISLEPIEKWIASPGRSPLDLLHEKEVKAILQEALDELGDICRFLLRAFYIEGRAMKEILRETGLKTVQGVYYRRSICLGKIASLLRARLAAGLPPTAG